MDYKKIKSIAVVAVIIIFIVWGFFVFRLYNGYGDTGYVSYVSELPILSEDFEGLRATGQIKYAFRRQARGQFCFITGQAEFDEIRGFWEGKEGWEITSPDKMIHIIAENSIQYEIAKNREKAKIITRWIGWVNADPCDFQIMAIDNSTIYAKKSSSDPVTSSDIEILYSPDQKRFAAIASRTSSD